MGGQIIQQAADEEEKLKDLSFLVCSGLLLTAHIVS